MTDKLKTKNYKINKKRFNDWLNSAIWFSIWHVSDKKHVEKARDFIFDDIGEKYQLSKNKSHDKQMLMLILQNLWVGLCYGTPIMIYSDKSRYGKDSAYSKVFMQYERTMRLIKHLRIKGYLQQKKGYFDREDGRRRITRIWGTEKLLRLLIEEYDFSFFDGIYQDKNVPLVQLNHKEIKRRFDKKMNQWIEKEYTVADKFDDTDLTLSMEYNLGDIMPW